MSRKTVSETRHAPLFIIGQGPEVPALDPEVAGSKAAMLAQMARLGLRVPPAFVLPTGLCGPLNQADAKAEQALADGLREGVRRLEAASGRRFGDSRRPLLVSVRSGAARSMPGMLSTVLDVGLNAETVRGLIRLTGDPRMAFDSYRRFIQGYAEIVADAPAAPFEADLAEMLRSEQAGGETELDPEALERLARAMQASAAALPGGAAPFDPMDQLLAAARAVYRSWSSPKAVEYRRLNRLEDLTGTAVTVQAMAFGNSGGDSGAGVAFSRSPATGEKGLYVDYLSDAQGEDVVSGRRTPGDADSLARRLPAVFRDLSAGAQRLEHELKDVQDIEFTVEGGQLFFLQTRSAKRTPRAVLRTAVDLVREGLIAPAEGLRRVADVDLDRAGVVRFVGEAEPAASAIPASSGVAAGRIAFDAEAAARAAARGEPAILVRRDISTEDIAGLAAAAGVLTAVGGRTAHAAVVARQLGKACLVGCRDLVIDGDGARLGEVALRAGDWLSLDGETGEVFLGRREIAIQRPEAEIAEIESWRAAAR
ncbi:MAG: PEP/pyruvate-binding domain-containing protein [Caulobacteraceae bacterium]|nr:PEP/pyruvate-binding domain-containing protein [Caulobacteraceae bacterium]